VCPCNVLTQPVVELTLAVGDGTEDLTLPLLQGDGEVSSPAAIQTCLSGGCLSFALAKVVQVCTDSPAWVTVAQSVRALIWWF
jgi:hypothetical protein